MSDLDKMMAKLKKPKKVEETQIEEPIEEEVEEEEEKEEEDEDEDVETLKETPKVENPKETPKEEDQEVSVEQEIAILQNDGIFRREVIGAMRELINVQKVNTQALIDLKKVIGGLANGK